MRDHFFLGPAINTRYSALLLFCFHCIHDYYISLHVHKLKNMSRHLMYKNKVLITKKNHH